MQSDGYDLYYNRHTCNDLGDFMFYNLSEHFLANTSNTINDIITRDIANDTTYDRKNIQQMIHVLMQYMSYSMACIFIVYAAGCGNSYIGLVVRTICNCWRILTNILYVHY